jgi:phage recombination protein Bet
VKTQIKTIMNKIEAINESKNFDVEKIKKYLQAMNLSSNLTTGEVEQFIEIAKSFNLNPFKREIYANKYGDKFSVIVGFETYIKRAERSGLLSGWNVRTEGVIDFQNIMNSSLRAIITIHRKDFEFPFVHEVYYSEYVGRKRDGSITEFWKNKPVTMTKKVAMAQGFRLCFSDELGGLPYTTEELSTIDEDAVVVETNKPERKKQSVQVIKPETIQKDTVRIRELLDKIKESKSKDDLVAIWKSNQDLHGEIVFKNAMTFRKNQLNENVSVDLPETEKENKNKTDQELFEIKKSMTLRNNQISIIDKIKSAETPEELFELTENETDKEILKAADERMKELFEIEPFDTVKNEIEH